jgi:hypothetical protein
MLQNNENLNSIIHLAQTLVLRIKDKSSITQSLIAEKVSVVLTLDPAMAEGVDIQLAVDELVRRFSLWIGQDSTLSSSEGHEPWLSAARKKDWRYWQRYRGWLERKMSTTAVDALDESTDRILGWLEDPKREGSWDRRGLVVGHVQSGKTGNYSGLVCKAADAGYKLVIVLAGLHNNLRSQTQIRLEEGFLGYETSATGDAVQLIGVGEIDSDSKIFPACFTNRSNIGDFNTKVANHLANRPEERPWLFVVKKNKTVLERLLKWIRNHVADTTDVSGRRYVSSLPLLLIDDEADHASVDTGEQLHDADGAEEEYQPKAINSRIRKILHSFSKSAYVGYTATPFANIFIHRRNETKEEGPDLFPSSFIINLAAPSNYVGPSRIFGLNGPDGRVGGLPLVHTISDHSDRDGTGGWMPAGHKKDHIPTHDGMDVMPPSLEKAVGAFVLACAGRVCRGQGREHSSMLVHVTRFTDVQCEVHRQVEEHVRRMKQRVSRGIDHESVMEQLHRQWQEDFEHTHARLIEIARNDAHLDPPPANPQWKDIAAVLPDVLADIDVRMINGTAKDALDYAENEGRGLKLIAIGGDKLARGLTLEGLCVSYFVRTSKMYDTLMQMGRWFGYRPGYLDLCRLYTTGDLVEWFGHIADASEELREEFDAMVESGGTPKDYGLKVKSHDVLLVTSPLKMRSAETLNLSFSGDLIQTVALQHETPALQRNLDATNRLILAMGVRVEKGPTRERDGAPDRWPGAFVWNDVPAGLVIDFLASYQTSPAAYRVNSAMLVEFIEKMVARGELTTWTVALLGGGKPASYLFECGLKLDAMPTRTNTSTKGGYSIGVLTDPSDEGIDLGYDEWKAALNMTLAAWKPDPGRNRITPPTRPSGKMIRKIRGLGAAGLPASPQRGVLLLYPLAPPQDADGLSLDWRAPVMAFGISFPASESGETVAYKVDHLKWEEEYGAAD